MKETSAGCRNFVRKDLETQPLGRLKIILDDNKMRVFFKEAGFKHSNYKGLTQ
jgi:hypothetical protein